MMIQLTLVLSNVAVKRSKTKNYYKLGVPKNYGDAEIKKAYVRATGWSPGKSSVCILTKDITTHLQGNPQRTD